MLYAAAPGRAVDELDTTGASRPENVQASLSAAQLVEAPLQLSLAQVGSVCRLLVPYRPLALLAE